MAMLRRRAPYANVAVLAGHSTIRTAVMGEAASQRDDATPEELAKMKAMVADAMANGAIGLGASYSLNHSGYGGVPMPSTIAPMAELDALVGAMGPRGKGVIAIASGVKTPQELEPMAAKYGRPFFQGTGMAMYNEQEPTRAIKIFDDCAAAIRRGNGLYIQIPCQPLSLRLHDGQRLSVLQPFGLRPDQGLHARAAQGGVPRPVVARQVPRERQEPAARHDLPGQLGSRDGGGGAEARQRQVRQPLPARDRRRPSIAIRSTSCSTSASTRISRPPSSAASSMSATTAWRKLLKHEAGVVALSDAGAHLIYMCDAGFGLHFLARWVRERGDFDIVEGIRRLTSHPADLYGIQNRGRIAVGAQADLLLFDPATVGVSARPSASPTCRAAAAAPSAGRPACTASSATASRPSTARTTSSTPRAPARCSTGSTPRRAPHAMAAQ